MVNFTITMAEYIFNDLKFYTYADMEIIHRSSL